MNIESETSISTALNYNKKWAFWGLYTAKLFAHLCVCVLMEGAKQSLSHDILFFRSPINCFMGF